MNYSVNNSFFYIIFFELRLFLGGFTEQLRKLQEEVDNKKAELARRMAQRDQFFTPPPSALMGAITTPPPSFREQPLGRKVLLLTYTSTQMFMATFSYLLAQKLWVPV